MNGPRTGKEALLAEILGDMDKILTRVEQAEKDLEQLRVSIENSHDVRSRQATRELEAATVKFEETTTRNVDAFTGVANETLAKFMQRTREIKELLDKPALAKPAPYPAQQATPAKTTPRKGLALRWFFPVIFSSGVVAGVLASFFITR